MAQRSDAQRIMLEKYLRGDFKQVTKVTASPPILRRSPEDIIPLTFGQQQLWLLSQIIGDTPVYIESVSIHIPGTLNIAALERSINEIINRHEAWRTSFSVVEGQPIQVVSPSLTVDLPIIDLRNVPVVEQETEMHRAIAEDRQKPFDLARVPLFRIRLVRLSDQDQRLLLTLHHIIFDGFSLYQIFLPELYALYEAFAAGQPSPLAHLTLQYPDVAIWQRQQEKNFTQQLDYWKEQLADVPPALELPVSHPRPSVPDHQGARHTLKLSKHLTDNLRNLSRQEGCTLYMTLLAAFNTLLYRYTGQDDILVGTITGGRDHAEVQKLLGVFINTLVMRTRVVENPRFRELLKQVKEVTLEALAHQDAPFEYVVRELHPEREYAQNPFFQVLLVVEPPQPILQGGWTLSMVDAETHTSKFDLSFILEDQPDGLIGRIEYSTALFESETIAQMAEHWQILLESIVANPDQRLSELAMLTDVEQHLLLHEWNGVQTTNSEERFVHQQFEEQVKRQPDAVALTFQGQHVTYGELNTRANLLAHHLQISGAGPDVFVGLCMNRSVEMIVALLAILKAGSAYVPLDPMYPSERLTFMLHDAQIPLVLTNSSLRHLFVDSSATVFCLDTEWATLDSTHTENPVSEVQGHHLAYLIYTSGSTGRPKGVEVTHRNVWHSTQARLSYYQERVASFLLLSSIAFDSSVAGIFWTLCQGGVLLLPTEAIVQDPFHLCTFIAQEHPSHLLTVPSLYSLLIELAEPYQLQSLRTAIVAGERCPRELVVRHNESLPDCTLFNEYGPTEASVWSTVYRCERQERRRSIPIGHAISGVQVYVLNESLQLVPAGAVGELYIGGAGVARGYHNRAELNAERFIPNPFHWEANARLYRTGDLVRYLTDGNLEFVGRVDQQVKLRGYRIELGEIEEVLIRHFAVREARVLVYEHGHNDKRLVAYVVFSREHDVLPEELRSFLREHLPEYMIPLEYISLSALPLTSNGKLDRRALPAPKMVVRTSEENFVAPKCTEHYQLVQIWERLLNVQPISIKDNFFHLGGHSLLAARLVDKIEQTFGRRLSLATLFAGPTIEQLAIALSGREENASHASLITVQTGGDRKPFFYLHGDWTSGAFYCFKLALALGADQPFYILEPYKFEGLSLPPTLEDMAAAHIEAMRRVQPEGPYMLGGFCNGGLVANEMARQLSVQGQEVALLILIDPSTVAPHRLIRNVITRIGNFLRLDQSEQLKAFLRLDWFLLYIHLQLLKFRSASGIFRRTQASQSVQPGHEQGKKGTSHPVLRSILPKIEALRQDWPSIYRWVASGYTPDRYPGKITLFWSSEAYPRRGEWHREAEADEIETHVIPGTHKTCRTEHLHVLAEHLGTCLNKVHHSLIVTQQFHEMNASSPVESGAM